MKRILTIVLLVIFSCLGSSQVNGQVKKPGKKLNVLFIAVDDLKPVLGCYGDKLVKTPNIDKLSEKGTVFIHNYCQQAVCGPSRASIMTGMRPDYTGIWDLKTRMRDVNPDILAMPQYFVQNGYETTGIGKVYDPRCVDDDLDKPSWSIPYFTNSNEYFSVSTGKPEGQYQNPETKQNVARLKEEGKEKGLDGKALSDFVKQGAFPSVECVDVPDNAYIDGANVLHAKDILARLGKNDKPFFFAVGITKPHLPFIAPKKYWDLYNREEMPLAPFQQKSENGPEIAYHHASELYAYTDIPSLAAFSDQKVGLDLPVDKQKELIHGYYASVSYADAQVGILLKTLDSLGLSDNTIVVLWGDHGWHLGDHNLWCKHTNFEQAAHAPLLISAPGIKSSKTNAPTEFIDVFPTLCELTGLTVPPTLDGKSLVPVMKNPKNKVKDFAVSQYPRTRNKLDDERLGWSDGQFMGYSIRTEQYRYTVWMKDGYRSEQPFRKDLMVASELYDYKKDPNETINVTNDKKYASVSKDMQLKMEEFFSAQAKNK